MKIAFIFPGQGSQSIGMLSDLYHEFSIVKDIFLEANDILGFDLWNIIQNDKVKLNQTLYTQNAMLVSGFACFKILQKTTNIQANIMAGHSLGEITALVAGGSIKFSDSLKIVKKRAELMQSAVPIGSGSMAAILGLDDKKVIEICNDYKNGIVEAVNFNATGQVVIAGEKQAVIKTCDNLKKAGAKRVVILNVSVPSHSSLMVNIANEFANFIADFDFKMPAITILHNVDAKPANTTIDIKEKIIKQLYNPVLWTTIIKNMEATTTIEIGAGKVLSGLNRRIDKNINSLMIFDKISLDNTLEQLNGK